MKSPFKVKYAILQKKFRKYIAERQLFRKEDSLLVAVSGGMDSMILCHLLSLEKYQFSVAHCNFQLRGEEAEEDAVFVKKYFEADDRPVYIKTFDTIDYAKRYKVGIQEAARNLRYEWFQELSVLHNFKYILTGHHANDSIETLFLNFVKGTGIHGFHGILPQNGKIVRPLLFALKRDLSDYAVYSRVPFREDLTNLSDKYARNLIRNRVIPIFQVLNLSFEETALENIARFSESEALYNWAVEKIKSEAVELNSGTIRINQAVIYNAPAPGTVLFEIIKDFDFNSAQARDIIRRNASGRMFYSSRYCLLADRTYFYIKPITDETESEKSFEVAGLAGSWESTEIGFVWRVAGIEEVDKNKEPSNAYLDADRLKFPMRFRRWKAGDSFQPYGLDGKSQKLSDFFNNLRLSKFEKEKIWVLESDPGDICWIAGWRVDHRFRATTETQTVVKFTIEYKYP